MENNFFELNIETKKRIEFVDVTARVLDIVKKTDVKNGVCYIYVPHTTCALTINENADPDVVKDLEMGLSDIVRDELSYRHSEGNSPAHLKSSLLGASQIILINDCKFILGVWQAVYFCEFDGPRNRRLFVKIVNDR
ncbi:protein belonging to Uncharacterized protein family UPF0047 [Candidatus Omnitrophus magneticus]|uniref:Protein belonging to Uncharacterized protein family UPF0047 n=1 Tax=Candidatus Omnitrophus magneticus TaxID=1609969 RepID=A0A0F0CTM3_9BACT|nr:protein belonging to Uncharacterized protein family UPF0047 [Candidatus Omnitrophus magneticus]